MVKNPSEYVRGGLAPLLPDMVLHLKDDVKIPTQDQALMRIQYAKEGGYPLVEAYLLRAHYQGINVDKV